MNYLAHLYLARNFLELMPGNYIADMVTRNEATTLSEKLRRGIDFHRSIDKFTDEHKAVKEVNNLLRANHRKYAPVVSDIFFDYLLAENWHKYHDVSLHSFKNKAYKTILNDFDNYPTRIQPIITLMIKGDFVNQYSTKEGMVFTFDKIQAKARFNANFLGAIDDYNKYKSELCKHFEEFFPDIVAFTDNYYS